MLRTCNFCDTEYSPRPQVKSPRACSKMSCQNQRQRSNEREWRQKNGGKYGSEYFRKWRKQSHQRKNRLAVELLESLKVGMTLRGRQEFDFGIFREFIGDFLGSLGMRSANKLCYH